MNREFLKLTKVFPDVAEAIGRVKSVKRDLSRATRRARSLEAKYQFLQDMVDIKSHDDMLDSALKNFFKALGYKDVRKVGKKYQREDLQVWADDKLIVIEAKGITRPTPSDHECEQIAKYMRLRRHKISDRTVFGLFVVNHDNEKCPSKRNPTPFDENKVKYAEAGEYGLTTTIELLKAFVEIKMGRLTIIEFENKICAKGLIGFESRSQKVRPTAG